MKLAECVGDGVRKVDLVILLLESVVERELVVLLAAKRTRSYNFIAALITVDL